MSAQIGRRSQRRPGRRSGSRGSQYTSTQFTRLIRRSAARSGRACPGRGSAGTTRWWICRNGVGPFRPVVGLAYAAGIETGVRRAIRVNRRMETNVSDVYAAGDCVETWHRLLRRAGTFRSAPPRTCRVGWRARTPSASPPSSRARSARRWSRSSTWLWPGAGCLRTRRGRPASIPSASRPGPGITRRTTPGAHELTIRITGDRGSRLLLGAQMLGHVAGHVAKRIDVFATALFHGMSVDALNDLDLS